MFWKISRLSCIWKAILVIGLALSFSGCIAKQDIFLQIVVCVVDDQGVEDFKILMRKIAEEENLKVVDASRETARNLQRLNIKDIQPGFDPDRHLFFGIQGWIDTFSMGGNFSRYPYQISLGFGAGHNPTKAHRLADRVVAEVSKRWRVEVTPEGQGSFPMKGCDG